MRELVGCVLVGLLAVAALGCDIAYKPAVDRWIAQQAINGEYNEMRVGRDYTGDATIFYYVSGDKTFYYADFDLTLTDAEIVGNEHKFRFDLDCDGECSQYDFRMDCDLSRDDEELECEGNGAWKDYDFFNWERD